MNDDDYRSVAMLWVLAVFTILSWSALAYVALHFIVKMW